MFGSFGGPLREGKRMSLFLQRIAAPESGEPAPVPLLQRDLLRRPPALPLRRARLRHGGRKGEAGAAVSDN